jgi:hypothetical protein
MTQHQNQITNGIRKSKKSAYLAQKRTLPVVSAPANGGVGSTVAMANTTNHQFKHLMQAYCQSGAAEQLQQMEGGLRSIASIQSQNIAENPLMILEQADEELALKFLGCLHQQAASSGITMDVQQLILRILVQLSSIQPNAANGDSDDYYGHVPVTWSGLIAQTIWMKTMVEILQASSSSQHHTMVEYACLVLGNILGEGTRHIPKDAISKPTLIAALIKAVSMVPPQASWALTNMIRNDHVSLASTYCAQDLLTAPRLMQWLQHPPIATQTAWMIASLTGREPEMVFYLCRHLSFLSALVQALQSPLAPDQAAPLIQALGNIASHETMVPPLLLQTNPPLVPLLQQLLQQTPSSRGRNSNGGNLLSLTAWLSGCLLIDAGMDQHPSTTVAAPALIPALMLRLGEGESYKSLTLEESRDVAVALWNALSRPPQMEEEQQLLAPTFGNVDGGFNFATLAASSSKHTPPANLPFAVPTTSTTLKALVRLASSKDADAVLAAVNVLDLLVRRSHQYDPSLLQQQSLLRMMQEEGVENALEQICDSAVEEAAVVAADLFDDYFDQDD